MSALPDHGQFQTAADQPFFIVATLWRGAMVERYARIEFFVDRTLKACAAAGIDPAAKLAEHLPAKRIEALLASLRNARLVGHSQPALQTLSAIKQDWQRRNALCHGRMKVLKRSVRIEWTSYTKGMGTAAVIRLSDTGMLRALLDLDRAQSLLGARLGHIDRRCEAPAPFSPCTARRAARRSGRGSCGGGFSGSGSFPRCRC